MNKTVKFNSVPIGSVLAFGLIKVVKIRDADIGVPLSKQKPNCIRLDGDNHYSVLSNRARVSVIKTPEAF